MGSNKETSSQLDMDAKWNACVDITLRRLVYSSLAGACSALMLFSFKGFYSFLGFLIIQNSEFSFPFLLQAKYETGLWPLAVGINPVYLLLKPVNYFPGGRNL
eukprot:Gb_11497 [translate_table: standard]